MGNYISEKKGSSSFKIIIGLMLVILIVGASVFAYYKTSLAPVSKTDQEKIDLEIVSGTSTDGISRILEENGLIKNGLVFKIYVKLSNNLGKLKAGKYELSKSMSTAEIVKELGKGGKSANIVNFTIPEGYELYLIADKLEEENLIQRDRFMELVSDKKNFQEEFTFLQEIDDGLPLEGFLFPSTYEIFKDASEEDIIRKMLEEFEIVYNSNIKFQAKELNMTLNEVITMASLIEREARVDDERKLIASVYYNRLDVNMKLQCDATVLYALGERKDRVLFKDLEIDSPYNTYRNYGLPIGPISSVGLPSIEAALYPEESDYLYYVATPEGAHVFNKTLTEHNKDREKYLESLNK